jgi:alpha-glucosidase
MRGTVFLYQGDELGLPQASVPPDRIRDPHSKRNLSGAGRDGARTPFPWRKNESQGGFSKAKETWLPLDGAHLDLALDEQIRDNASVYRFTKGILELRKRHPALVRGDCDVTRADDAVLAFIRSERAEKILCVFNLSDAAAFHALPAGSRLLESGIASNIVAGGVELPPWSGALALMP